MVIGLEPTPPAGKAELPGFNLLTFSKLWKDSQLAFSDFGVSGSLRLSFLLAFRVPGKHCTGGDLVEAEDYPANLIEFGLRFQTDEDCRAYVERLRWPNGSRCPTAPRMDGDGTTYESASTPWEIKERRAGL